jgi:hypothetical protein
MASTRCILARPATTWHARARPRRGERRENGKAAETHGAPEERGDQAPRPRRGNACGDWEKLQRIGLDDCEARAMTYDNPAFFAWIDELNREAVRRGLS